MIFLVRGDKTREREAVRLPATEQTRQPMPKLCKAWATCLSGLFGVVENRAGRTELMPNGYEACVESGSGQKKIRFYDRIT